jgi:hypothetical protein
MRCFSNGLLIEFSMYDFEKIDGFIIAISAYIFWNPKTAKPVQKLRKIDT